MTHPHRRPGFTQGARPGATVGGRRRRKPTEIGSGGIKEKLKKLKRRIRPSTTIGPAKKRLLNRSRRKSRR